MWELFVSAVLTSAVDSLNPIGITQQFVLQGLVKKPRHIWYFILPTGVTNFLAGLLAYYGFVGAVGAFLGQLVERYGPVFFTAELIAGFAFLVGLGILLQRKRAEERQRVAQNAEGLQEAKKESKEGNEDEKEMASRIKSVAPLALIALGVGATISELTSALPYFAFFAILFQHQIGLLQVSFILLVYNLIYMSPLMVLYFVYVRAQDKFDSLYRVIKAQITRWSNVLVPALLGVVGVALICHSISLLLKV